MGALAQLPAYDKGMRGRDAALAGLVVTFPYKRGLSGHCVFSSEPRMPNREHFVKRSRIDASPQAVYDWHMRPGALERLIPPWSHIRVLEYQGGVRDRGRVVLEFPIGPRRIRWVAEHLDIQPGRSFTDIQVEGPFALWRHTHLVQETTDHACMLEDRVEYLLPAGRVVRSVASEIVKNRLAPYFEYRHQTVRHDLLMQRPFTDAPPMRVLVSGSTGFIGSALVPLLTTAGHTVEPLVRPGRELQGIKWDPRTGELDPSAAGADAVIHLAAMNIGKHRWTSARKQQIRDSRVTSTRLLCQTLAKLNPKPLVLIAASAVGYYGDRGDEWLDERSEPGRGFLPETCAAWEEATHVAADAGIRVVNLRIGIVLSPRGGALRRMIQPFRFGLGGPVGSGNQYLSWISIDDVIGAIYHALMTPDLHGPVNATAPNPVTYREFARVLGRVLMRPAVVTMPATAARLLFGEMADEVILASARVRPMRLMQNGYCFRHESVEAALRHVLGR